MVSQKEDELGRAGVKKAYQEITSMLQAVEMSEQLKNLLQLPRNQLGSLSDKDLEQNIKQMNSKLDKRFKVLIRTHERTSAEETVMGLVCLLLQNSQNLENQLFLKNDQISDIKEQFE